MLLLKNFSFQKSSLLFHKGQMVFTHLNGLMSKTNFLKLCIPQKKCIRMDKESKRLFTFCSVITIFMLHFLICCHKMIPFDYWSITLYWGKVSEARLVMQITSSGENEETLKAYIQPLNVLFIFGFAICVNHNRKA